MSRALWALVVFAGAAVVGYSSGNKARDLLTYWAGRLDGWREAQQPAPKRLAAVRFTPPRPPASPPPLSFL